MLEDIEPYRHLCAAIIELAYFDATKEIPKHETPKKISEIRSIKKRAIKFIASSDLERYAQVAGLEINVEMIRKKMRQENGDI